MGARVYEKGEKRRGEPMGRAEDQERQAREAGGARRDEPPPIPDPETELPIGTPMDRCGDIEVHPQTGRVYSGEESESTDDPSSTWPDGDIPCPVVVAITGFT